MRVCQRASISAIENVTLDLAAVFTRDQHISAIAEGLLQCGA